MLVLVAGTQSKSGRLGIHPGYQNRSLQIGLPVLSVQL